MRGSNILLKARSPSPTHSTAILHIHLPIMASLLTILALSTLSHLTTATVGVLDIDDLLQPDLTAALHAPIEQNPNAPWTHPPHCTTSTALATLGQNYCVYTSNTTGPHGLSLIFKPEDAARATQYLNDIPLASFLTQKQAEALYLSGGQPWKVVPIPGKDKGVVATRRIKKFETFMLDQAAVVVDMELEKAISGRENSMSCLSLLGLDCEGGKDANSAL
jgi:hypothetical protein